MKKTTLLSSLLTVAVILSQGCTKSQIKSDTDKILADLNKQIDDINKDNDRVLENIRKLETQGGQPGLITLNGVVVLDANKLDTRITVSQTAGLTSTGSATAITSNTVVLNNIKSEEMQKIKEASTKLEEGRTYLNLGCELAESEIAGLKEVSASSGNSDIAMPMPSASRIFICGEHDFSSQYDLNLAASDIMLKDATIKMSKDLGGLDLVTKTLVLVGKNKISTTGKDASTILLSTPGINLTVTNEIYGDGELVLESKGGNNISESKKDSK